MKKLILIALLAVMMAGCGLGGKDATAIYDICIIDSCEYVTISGFSYPTHKGNCRFCEQRRKAEIREIVELLKDKLYEERRLHEALQGEACGTIRGKG